MHILDNVILFMFLSFVAGIVVDPILRRLTNYGSLSNRYLFSNPRVYELLGVRMYKCFLKSSPMGSFNKNIHIPKKGDLETMRAVRNNMASAEMSHWVGFILMLAMTFPVWFYRGAIVGVAYIIFNMLGNLYPCMLQQYNKRRLINLISVIEKRQKENSGTPNLL